MNKVFFSGRLTKDVELKDVGDSKVANGTIAVDRYNSDDTDFFVFSIWGKGVAEATAKYTKKGSRILISGSIHIDQAGDKYYTKVRVETVEFLDKPSKREEELPI